MLPPYTPPNRSQVSISLTDISQSMQSRVSVSINLTPEQQSGEAQYIGGDGWGLNSSHFGQSYARLQFQRISNPSIGNTLLLGTPGIFNQRDFISPSGINLNTYGRPTIYNLNRYIVGRGLSSFISGRANVQSTLAYIRPTGLNSFISGTAKAQSSKIEAKGFNSFTSGHVKIESLRAYIRAGAYDFFVSGKIRISYKEQHATTKQEKESTLWGKTLIAYGVRYVEQNSPSPLTRFGIAWASFSPRYIEPRGIFQQFPSYHRIGTSRIVKMEGFDFLRFGIRIIPENQTIFPIGFSTLFGDQEIRNNLHPIKPKGFLSAGEQIGMRFGHVTIFNATQYLLPFHDDTSRAAGPLFPDIKKHEIANLNRTVKTHGRINTLFGYADLINKARVIYPVGLSSPLEVEPTKTLVADGIRYIKPTSIAAPYFTTWHTIWLGAQVKAIHGDVLTLYGIPHIENTRRIYRFVSLGEQTLFGKGMISHAVRGIRIESDYSISPPVISMPEVKLGVRYVEPRSVDSVRYGWMHLAEQFTKIAPRWVHIDRVGEPAIRNLTPQVKPWHFEAADYGNAYIGLYTRYIKPSGLNAQSFSRARVSDRKQDIDLRNYGIQPPTITKLHKIENLGAGQLLPHVIHPPSMTTKNFSTDQDKLHKVRQNVIRPESDKPMTQFGNTKIHANSIRVEPGYWEILIGRPLVEHKNRKVYVDSGSCDFLTIGKPRMSPLTIWAVVEAPTQAKGNHDGPTLPLHYVDGLTESGNTKYPGIEVGTPRISHKNRRLNPPGYLAFGIGKPTIYNVVTKIEPKGWNSLRLGVLGPIGDQHISFRPKDPMTQWGSHSLVSIIRHDGKLKPAGFILTEMGKPMIDFYHRAIKPVGLHSLTMGTRKADDKPYMWQGLRVGVHVPTQIGNLDALKFGSTWISYRVREAVVKGDDFSVVSEYEPGKFNLKMTIRNAKQPEYPRAQQVIMKGFVAEQFGTPDAKLKLHFIRPDGNSDNFRKGVL